jgi:hypothetical protein
VLRWPLSSGALYTHLREEDGEEMADVTIQSLSVTEGKTGLPFLLAYLPLAFDVDPSRPAVEEAMYFSGASGFVGSSIRFSRPGFLAQGEVLVAPAFARGGATVIRAGVGEGTEVQLVTLEEVDQAEQVVTAIAGSFRVG